ncbi:MAG: methyltransferase domain-containing protein [Thermomicrobiales bacterium]
MTVRLRPLLVGVATYLPGLRNLTTRRTGGTISARYCYTVWLRHLVMARRHSPGAAFGTVAELGPGDSLGLGLAALLSGAERYIALDVVRYTDSARNIAVFDELVALFRNREPVPDDREFPLVRPLLPSYDFPHDILPDAALAAMLNSERLAMIRRALVALDEPHRQTDQLISYVVPWDDASIAERASVDLILSQAVLEYPHDLAGTYAAMERWLKPGGMMSHDIDFKSHGLTREWSGHWACSDFIWSLMEGRRRDILNRAPHSVHLDCIRALGCEIVCDQQTESPAAPRARLAPRFRYLTDEDVRTSSAFIQAYKPR